MATGSPTAGPCGIDRVEVSVDGDRMCQTADRRAPPRRVDRLALDRSADPVPSNATVAPRPGGSIDWHSIGVSI